MGNFEQIPGEDPKKSPEVGAKPVDWVNFQEMGSWAAAQPEPTDTVEPLKAEHDLNAAMEEAKKRVAEEEEKKIPVIEVLPDEEDTQEVEFNPLEHFELSRERIRAELMEVDGEVAFLKTIVERFADKSAPNDTSVAGREMVIGKFEKTLKMAIRRYEVELARLEAVIRSPQAAARGETFLTDLRAEASRQKVSIAEFSKLSDWAASLPAPHVGHVEVEAPAKSTDLEVSAGKKSSGSIFARAKNFFGSLFKFGRRKEVEKQPTAPEAQPSMTTRPLEGSPEYQAAYQFNTLLHAILHTKIVDTGEVADLSTMEEAIRSIVNKDFGVSDHVKFDKVKNKILLATLKDKSTMMFAKPFLQKILIERGYLKSE